MLDAVAIAGQVIVGRALGAGDGDGAYAASVRMIGWSTAIGAVIGAVLLGRGDLVLRAFTSDPAVLAHAARIWPIFCLMQPLNGAAFALDGILIGASDTRFLMVSMVAAALGVFVPIAIASLALGWGIVGVWAGLVALIAVRLAATGVRFLSRRWEATGVPETA